MGRRELSYLQKAKEALSTRVIYMMEEEYERMVLMMDMDHNNFCHQGKDNGGSNHSNKHRDNLLVDRQSNRQLKDKN